MKKKLEVAIAIISILPLLVYTIVYNLMGATMPIAWNSYGEVTQYVTKSISVFIIPFTALFVSVLLFFVKRISNKKDLKIFTVSYNVFWLFIAILLAFVTMFPLYLVQFDGGNTYNVLAVSLLVVSILVMIMGFVFPKIKADSKYGFKTPWTNASKDVFVKTQQIAGVSFILGSLVLIALTLFITKHAVIAVSAYILVALILILIPLLYSKKTYENEE